MDFDSGWDNDEDDDWDNDEDDDWKRKKRETMKKKEEKVEKTRKKRKAVETPLFPEEENRRIKRALEEVEMHKEESKRMKREAAAKWRKGTQVWHSPVSAAKYLKPNICIGNIFILGVKYFYLQFCCFSPGRMWWQRWRNSGGEQTTLLCGFLRWSGL